MEYRGIEIPDKEMTFHSEKVLHKEDLDNLDFTISDMESLLSRLNAKKKELDEKGVEYDEPTLRFSCSIMEDEYSNTSLETDMRIVWREAETEEERGRRIKIAKSEIDGLLEMRQRALTNAVKLIGKNGGDVIFNPDNAPNQDVADIFKKVLTDIYGDRTTPPVDTPESKSQVNPPQEEEGWR